MLPEVSLPLATLTHQPCLLRIINHFSRGRETKGRSLPLELGKLIHQPNRVWVWALGAQRGQLRVAKP